MFSGISPVQLLIVLVIVLAIFGTKKFRSIGSDIGGAVKGFRSAMSGLGRIRVLVQRKGLPQADLWGFAEDGNV